MAQDDTDPERNGTDVPTRPIIEGKPGGHARTIPWFFLLYCLIIGLITGAVGYFFYAF